MSYESNLRNLDMWHDYRKIIRTIPYHDFAKVGFLKQGPIIIREMVRELKP